MESECKQQEDDQEEIDGLSEKVLMYEKQWKTIVTDDFRKPSPVNLVNVDRTCWLFEAPGQEHEEEQLQNLW